MRGDTYQTMLAILKMQTLKELQFAFSLLLFP